MSVKLIFIQYSCPHWAHQMIIFFFLVKSVQTRTVHPTRNTQMIPLPDG